MSPAGGRCRRRRSAARGRGAGGRARLARRRGWEPGGPVSAPVPAAAVSRRGRGFLPAGWTRPGSYRGDPRRGEAPPGFSALPNAQQLLPCFFRTQKKPRESTELALSQGRLAAVTDAWRWKTLRPTRSDAAYTQKKGWKWSLLRRVHGLGSGSFRSSCVIISSATSAWPIRFGFSLRSQARSCPDAWLAAVTGSLGKGQPMNEAEEAFPPLGVHRFGPKEQFLSGKFSHGSIGLEGTSRVSPTWMPGLLSLCTADSCTQPLLEYI